MGDDSNSRQRVDTVKATVDKWLSSALAAGAGFTMLYGLAAGLNEKDCGLWFTALCHLSPWYSHIVGMLLAMCIAGGALALGVMAGFLFGLPRSLTSGEVREIGRITKKVDDARNAADDHEQPENSTHTTASGSSGYGANTNLERISDWLTTIIVGVGLTNLSSLPPSIERFGDRIDGLFFFGGKAFGIGGGLFFLIFGFLMSYINTRTKLLLIFTDNDKLNDKINKDLANSPAVREAITKAREDNVIQPTMTPPDAATLSQRGPMEPSKADQIVLEKLTLQAKQTPDEMLALANASARSQDYAKAKVLYEDYLKTVANPAPDVLLNYAGVLGLNGDHDAFTALIGKIGDADRVSLATTACKNFLDGMRTALQANLYNNKFEDSIRIGEMLIKPDIANQDTLVSDPWVHLWLACAYGQKHARLNLSENRDAILVEAAAARAVEEVARTLAINPSLQEYIASLYDPRKIRGDDNDLMSLYGDPRMEELLRTPAPEQTGPEQNGPEQPGPGQQEPEAPAEEGGTSEPSGS